MRKLLACALLAAFSAWAANIKLYLKDGGYHIVREYQVQGDRVRFYSVERSDWEEMPLELIDLKRTETETAARKESLEKETAVIAQEDAAERELQKEVSRIPQDPGVYWVDGEQTHYIRQAESYVKTNKGSMILKKLAPIPVVAGKGTLEIKGPTSERVFTNPEQEFYIQLSTLERFGIAALKRKGDVRIVENLTFMPVTNETVEERTLIPILQRELAEGLYKFWPKEPLPAGEYAVVQFSEGKLNIQIWDFTIKPGGSSRK